MKYQIEIEEQIEAIRKATKQALASKESARKFLRDAGIIKDDAISKKNYRENKKNRS